MFPLQLNVVERNINKESQKSPSYWVQTIERCLSRVVWRINAKIARILHLLILSYFIINICFCYSICHLYVPVICFLTRLNSTDWLVAPRANWSTRVNLSCFFCSVVHPATICHEVNIITLCWALIVTIIFMIKCCKVLLNYRKELHSVRILLSTKEMIRKILQWKNSVFFMSKELRRLRTSEFGKWICQNENRSHKNKLVSVFLFKVLS